MIRNHVESSFFLIGQPFINRQLDSPIQANPTAEGRPRLVHDDTIFNAEGVIG